MALGLVAAACSSSAASTSPVDGTSNMAPDGTTNGTADAGVGTGAAALTLEGRFATAVCTQLARCGPGIFARNYKDQTDCIAQRAPTYAKQLHATSVSITDAQMSGCVTKLGASSCDDAPSCKFTGTLDTSAACEHDAQCKSGGCYATSTDTCGKCTAVVAAGADCSAARCEEGTYCSGSSKTCTAFADAGAACGSGVYCKGTLLCGGAGAAKTCLARVDTGGDCSGDKACADGLECVDARCVAGTYAPLGGKCGYDGTTDRFIDCAASNCTGLDDQYENGTCTAWPTLGAPCDVDNYCVGDLVCTGGKCINPFDRLVCN